MERVSQQDKAAYRSIVSACRKKREGVTVAGLTAKTTLPLVKVRELLPAVADEYSARLRVTESGEILYSFPGSFKSRYRGIGAAAGRFFEKAAHIIKAAATNLFKVWILTMLVGYFVLFVVIALAAVVVSFAAQSSSRDGRDSRSRDGGGNFFVVTHLIDLLIRIWFYSELTKSFNGSSYQSRPPRKPLYKAVFSFVFGDGDLNAGIDEREKRAVLAYVQSTGGVIALPEYMILTGKSPAEAEDAITAFCAAYGGSPEATDDGTVVYRFDALMLNGEHTALQEPYTGPLRRLNSFSNNEKKFNWWFSVLNGVNLLFGGYFIYNALSIGVITDIAAAAREAYLYAFVYNFVDAGLGAAAQNTIFWVLGMVPLSFSLLFWLIPFLRNQHLHHANERVKQTNFRQYVYDTIWKRPRTLRCADLKPAGVESRPCAFNAACTKLINEFSAYSPVDVTADDAGDFTYTFAELERERGALNAYRARTRVDAKQLGAIVYDSEA
ncbi:MAG: hypothetical protein LBD22_05670 [Spirochaetaceae bacterium]|nr:hypothetical protein [Spirochaetaceae bacterium]